MSEDDAIVSRHLFAICSRDSLPDQLPYNRPIAVIINTGLSTGPGEHWVLAYFLPNKSGAYFFDSLGKSPDSYNSHLKQWLFKFGGDKIERNSASTQPEFSIYCGLHVLFVLYYLTRGQPFSAVIRKFTGDLIMNDRKVQQFAYKRFGFDSLKQIKTSGSLEENKMKLLTDLTLLLQFHFL
ncbi:MAG: hypothetical protein GY858_05445 [Candidatus Omnitrophica bacterium]|nr:hypothetical protein [Candidatus Omnitrophota bacterium]